MKQENEQAEVKLLPKEARLLDLYFQGLKYYLCAKLAGYKAKSKQALANTTRRIVKKYVSQAGKDDISGRADGHTATWWRDLQKVKRYCWAKKKTKDYLTALKMQGEAIGALKAKEFEADTGATIIINTDGKAQEKQDKEKKPDKPKQVGKVFSFPIADGESDS